jgi:isochorismate hydrolase
VAVGDGAIADHHFTLNHILEKEKEMINTKVVISFMKQDYLHRDNKTTVISASMKFDIEKQCVCHREVVAVGDGTKDNHHSTLKYIPKKEKEVINTKVVISFMKQDYLHRDNKTTVTSVSMKFDIEKQCVCDKEIVAVEYGAKDNHHSTLNYIPEKEKAVINTKVVISFMKQDYLHRDNKTTATSVSMKFDIVTQYVCD